MSLRFCRRCGWPHVDDATCAEMLRDIASKARRECVEPSDGSAAVGGSPAGTGAVPPLTTAALGALSDGQGVAAVVADLPQLDGGEAGVVDGLVPVTAVGAAVVGEVVEFEDRDPTAGAGVAGEGHVTDGGSETLRRQEVSKAHDEAHAAWNAETDAIMAGRVATGTPCPCRQGTYEKCRGSCGGWRCYSCDYEGSSVECDETPARGQDTPSR